jgi:uncharacterized membrane protein YgdD (TMEM256/DUF423 family)
MENNIKGNTPYLSIISFTGALAVVLGAFGAHALKDSLGAEQLAAYKTGVLYHFIHTLLLLGVYLLIRFKGKDAHLKRAFWFTFAGIICFSGSLYMLTTQELTEVSFSFLGPVTPIGGLLFVAGWISMGLSKK